MKILIDTPRLQMRRFTLADAEAVLAFSSNPEVTRYTGDAGMITTLAEAKAVIRDIWLTEYDKYGYARYALIHKQDNKIIGFCGLKYISEFQAADLGYRMLPEYWGQGLGMEAAKAALTYGLNELGLPIIVAEADVNNTASNHILAKLGFAYQSNNEKWGLTLKRYVYKQAFPVLETPRLTLAQQSDEDADAVFELLSQPEVVAYYDLARFTERQQAIDLLAKDAQAYRTGKAVRWAIRLKRQAVFIGSCGIGKIDRDNQCCVIGYELAPEHWRQGYGQEFLTAITRWVLAQGINRIEAYVLPENQASKRLLEKVGFRHEGLQRQKGVWQGGKHDLDVFSLLKSDLN